MKSRYGRSAAFTLVELLVVIGIIAVMISILLPALNKARRAGQTVSCASNMRQLGFAFNAYINDNHGMIPYAAIDDSSLGWYDNWPHSINQYLGQGAVTAAGRYNAAKVYACPSDKWVLPAGFSPLSYGMTCQGDEPGLIRTTASWGTLNAPPKISRLMPSPEIILLVERHGTALGSAGVQYGNTSSCPYDQHAHMRLDGSYITDRAPDYCPHSDAKTRRWNYLFCDGHVSFLSETETVNKNPGTGNPYGILTNGDFWPTPGKYWSAARD